MWEKKCQKLKNPNQVNGEQNEKSLKRVKRNIKKY